MATIDMLLARIRDTVDSRKDLRWKDMDRTVKISPEESLYLKANHETTSADDLKKSYGAVPEDAHVLGDEYRSTGAQISTLDNSLGSLRAELRGGKSVISAIGGVKEQILHCKAKMDSCLRQYEALKDYVQTSEGYFVRLG